MMTRKDYIEFAKILREATQSCEAGFDIPDVTIDIADYFERDNPNFNKDKFLEACNEHMG